MKKIWDITTKTIGTIVICFGCCIGCAIVKDILKEKLFDNEKEDDVEYIDPDSFTCPYKVEKE